ncbi:hypothetical protein N1031_17150 [Herbiconiux moechotypicola]|uniref:Uncharacterized protein n=1 Tax=Herbiconiux moechotypicola TaxID=637393 RepID=A0ABN3DR52_9MICO|nr:hypothetical protein [Herbiconiux moechotypicola]MCS5731491.1 hypothetical protein [Herbiconiux moechotypicola]
MVSTTRRRPGRRHEDRFYTNANAQRSKRLAVAGLLGGLGIVAIGLTWVAMLGDHLVI